MNYSVGVEYAFHTLFYMIDIPKGKTISIKELAKLNNISETYLSKISTKLKKAGIVRSVPGVNGGYELAKPANMISFWDVVEAIEGPSNIFQCAELRYNNTLNDNDDLNAFDSCPCLIKTVMYNAEEQMRNYLREHSLEWLHTEVSNNFSPAKKENIANWINCSTTK